MAELTTATLPGTYDLSEIPVNGTEHKLQLDFGASVPMSRLDLSFMFENISRTTEIVVSYSLDDISYSVVSNLSLNNQHPEKINIKLGESLGNNQHVYLKFVCGHEPDANIAGECQVSAIALVARNIQTGLVISSLSANHNVGKKEDSVSFLEYDIATSVDVTNFISSSKNEFIVSSTLAKYQLSESINTSIHTSYDGSSHRAETVTELKYIKLEAKDSSVDSGYDNNFRLIDRSYASDYVGILPVKDFLTSAPFDSVDRFYEKPKKPADYRYLPTSDFDIGSGLIGFTSDFSEPHDFEKLRTRMSPIGFGSAHNWSRPRIVDTNKDIKWGYSINAFLVGGSVITVYPVDPDAINPGPTPNPTPNPKVVFVVNNIDVIALPSGQAIKFDSLRMSYDLDSFSWELSISVLDQNSFDLMKPSSSGLQEVEVTLNSTKWNFLIRKAKRSKRFGETTFSATGYSKSLLLQAPLAAKNNYLITNDRTASQIANEILVGTGFTFSWDIGVNWTIPAKTYSVQNSSPIEALSNLVTSVGGVIVPDRVNQHLVMRPWTIDSPWAWSGLTGLPVINESLCYDSEEDYFPEAQANAVFVSGASNGVIHKCILPATPGNTLLQTVTNPLLTDTFAAKERGRIELAKSGHKENVPLSTYVGAGVPLYMPGEMVQVDTVDSTAWNGLVTSLVIEVFNEGAEVTQNLNVLRHHG